MSNTDFEIKASKVPARNQYGQNGSPMPPSMTPGQMKSPIADVSPPTCDVPGLATGDQLSARVSPDAAPIPLHSGAYHRSTTDGSPGGTIPAKLNRTPKR